METMILARRIAREMTVAAAPQTDQLDAADRACRTEVRARLEEEEAVAEEMVLVFIYRDI